MLREMTFLYTWALELFFGMQFEFCFEVSFSGEVRTRMELLK